jgi:glycosyltransferase involved in cell wall biosynthesis
MPEISVLIPSYNRADLLPRALDSVWQQDFDDLEVLVVDDGSSDGTIDWLDQHKKTHPQLRYVIHDRNKGEAAARNTALREARGTYVAFLDSDDEWLPGKLAAQHRHMTSASPDVAAVITAAYLVDGETKTLADDWHLHEPVTVRRLLVKGCGLNLNNTILMKRETALAAGDYDESLRLYVDLDWLMRFLSKGRLDVIPEPYAVYYKAPWRDGRLVEKAAQAFRGKNATAFAALSPSDRRRAAATLAWNSAICYRSDGDKWNYLRQASKALGLWPWVPIGNYIAIPDMFAGGRLLPALRHLRFRLAGGDHDKLPATNPRNYRRK